MYVKVFLIVEFYISSSKMINYKKRIRRCILNIETFYYDDDEKDTTIILYKERGLLSSRLGSSLAHATLNDRGKCIFSSFFSQNTKHFFF